MGRSPTVTQQLICYWLCEAKQFLQRVYILITNPPYQGAEILYPSLLHRVLLHSGIVGRFLSNPFSRDLARRIDKYLVITF